MGTKTQKSTPDRELVEFKAILNSLKKVLKERKISYRDLANKIGLSESGLKKIFASQDCSYGRLSQIAHTLGFRMVDLLDEIDHAETKSVQFSKSQQQFFLKNMKVFNFFVKLAIERQSLSEIKTEFGLQDRDVFSFLKKLDELGLIQLLPENRIKLPPLALVKDFGAGVLLETVYREWGTAIVQDLAHPKFQSSGQFIVRALKMKAETYEELLERLLALETEFLKRAVREMSISPEKLKTVRWMWMTDARSFIRGNL